MTSLDIQVEALSPQVTVDRHATGAELIELAFWNPTITGRLPHLSTVHLDDPAAPAGLLDASFSVLRTATSDAAVAVLAERHDSTILIQVDTRGTTVRVAAGSNDAAASITAEVQSRMPTKSDRAASPIRVWHRTPAGGFAARQRNIETPAWADIEHNYPSTVRTQITWVQSLVEPAGAGKILLWHGEPGTGKTTAIRSLFRTWAPWCAAEYIADPERFFDDPGYIADVISRPTPGIERPSYDHAVAHEQTWRVLVAEDVDDILRTTYGGERNTGLSRLLNLADGVLGQGVNSLVLLTTNEPVNRLHPALVRPGRALAQIEFGRFSPTEAAQWLGGSHPAPAAPAALADLYHLAHGPHPAGVSSETDTPLGQYL